MKKQRNASDVLFELEHKLDKIIGYIQTVDFNNKLILDRLTKATERFDDVKGPPLAQRASLKPTVTDNIPPQRLPPNVPGPPSFPNAQENAGHKCVVQQKITYSDNKHVILANVEIFDGNNNLIKKTRTSSSGKWSVGLSAGNYYVKVSKFGAAQRPDIQRSFNIAVSPGDNPLILDTLVVE